MKVIEKLKWNLHRWQRMQHPAEDFYRLKQVLHDKVTDRFLKVPFSFSMRLNALSFLNENFTNYKAHLSSEYPILNIKIPLAYNAWRTEPKNKKVTPQQYKGSLNYRSYEVAGENKYLYELNRLHVLPALAYSFADDRNTETFGILKQLVVSWKKENPFLHSLNWKSGIEAAIRIFNLVVSRLLLKNVNDNNVQQLCLTIDAMAAEHYYFLKGHLSLYSSANNHLLKELFGLVVLSAVYNYENSNTDLTKYFNFYQEELLKQTYEDGGSKEQSVHYHAAVLNCSLLVLLFAEKAGLKPGEAYVKRLQNMCVYLDEMTMGGKSESLFGDKDDSNILFDVFDADFNLYTSLLYTGKKLFGLDYNYFKQQPNIDFINAVLYDDVAEKSELAPLSKQSIIFKDSGYFIFKQAVTNSRLFFDFGEMGLAPLAAHGHSDSLHFTLWIKDQPFIVDPGVYQYNKIFSKWRNYFKGADAHNTISINNKDHAVSRGVMMWSDLPDVKLCNYKIQDDYAACEAEIVHRQKEVSVKHTRKIFTHNNGYVIKDSLSAVKAFQLKFSLHFHPSVTVQLNNNVLTAKNESSTLSIENELFENAVIYHGESENKIAGWYSSKYDFKEPSTTVQISKQINNNIQFETGIRIT